MNIEIYGKTDCPYCVRAKKMCDENSLPYVYYDIQADAARMAEFETRTNNATTVPQIFVGDTLIGGFTEFALALKIGQIAQLIGGE